MIPRPFAPQFGSNQVVALVAATPQIKNIPGDASVLQIVNAGAGDLYVRPYSSATVPAPVASALDFPVRPGTWRLIFVGDVPDRISLFSAAGTTAELMQGDGGI